MNTIRKRNGDTEQWRLRAACRGTADPEVFFPVGRPTVERLASAFAVCAGCHVIAECEAERPPSGYGVWGGKWWPPAEYARRTDRPAPTPVAMPSQQEVRAHAAALVDPGELLAACRGDSNTYRRRPA